MLKKRAMIYPVDRESIPLIRYNSLIKEYDIVYAVSPIGWGLEGKDCGTIDGGNGVDKIITTDFQSALNLCDTVIFIPSDKIVDFEKIIYPKFKMAMELEKEIICAIDIPNNYKEVIEKMCKDKELKYKQYQLKEDKSYEEINKEYLYDINVPVIGVFGISERTGKFNMQLAIREKLVAEGYKVSQVGSRHYCELLGFHSFPKFMMNNTLSESNKVMLFNHYLKKIELDENPDVIIVGIPGGVMPYSNSYTNRFGILAFEVCNAVSFDFVIMNILYNDYNKDYFSSIKNCLRYRLGLEVDGFNITPLKGDFSTLDSINRFEYLTLNSEFIDDKLKLFNNDNQRVFNIFNDGNKDELVAFLEDKLSSYSDIQCI